MFGLKKIIIALVFLFCLTPITASAGVPLEVYFFHSQTCPHCIKEGYFLDQLEKKYGAAINIQRFEVSQSQDNIKLLMDFGQRLQANVSGVPFLVIGDQYIAGFLSAETTGIQIENLIQNALRKSNDSLSSEQIPDPNKALSSLPRIGNIELNNLSLPALTIVLGILDGFNPCAMWALIFLISLLIGLKDRRRMWILGVVFLVTSAVVYFLFMAAWLNIILFLGFIFWVRIIIGLVAIGGGSWNIKSWYQSRGTCKITQAPSRRRIFEGLKKAALREKYVLAILGIIVLACAVNLLELVCSAGFPAVYVQVLAINHLSGWEYYSYILLYILFFMMDDLLVFAGAMITLRATGLSNKYAKYSSLIGGALMILIGLLLIFKHQWLSFG
ncbi:MAG: hypothetical protein C3F02_03085 [Parcubacteria group bacterium]|nr:MAG: hypothetical protein C3F02_03085 [Parcubacteria group bacterium]